MNIPDPRVQPTMTVQEAGLLLGLSKDVAYRAAHAGTLPVLRFGGRFVVPTARLLVLLGLSAEPS